MSPLDLAVQVGERVQPRPYSSVCVHDHHPRADFVGPEEAVEAFEGDEGLPEGVEKLVDGEGAEAGEGAYGFSFDVDGGILAE
jgi:hypothetical protein